MSRQPDPWKSLRDEFRKLQDQIRRMQAASPFFGTGFHPNGNNGIESDDFDGDLDAGDAGSKGWAFNSARAAIGELFLRPGSITNDALANPVVPAQAFQGASTFPLTVAGANVVTISRTVPAGFTSVVVNAYGRVAAVNSTASADALYCAVDVNGTGGNQFGMPVDASSFGSLSAGYSTLLTGLATGDPVSAHLYASTGVAPWASNAANGADLSATFLWFR